MDLLAVFILENLYIEIIYREFYIDSIFISLFLPYAVVTPAGNEVSRANTCKQKTLSYLAETLHLDLQQ